ncbi:MAG: redoxin domain-containing protein [Candidatus Babeliales bacterium]
MKDKLREARDEAGRVAEEKKDEARSTLRAVEERVKQKGHDVKEAVKKGTHDVAEKVKKARDEAGKVAEEKKDEAKGALSAAVEKVKQKGHDVKEAVRRGAHGVAEKVKKATKELKVGDDAPPFSLKDESGKVRTLEEFKGKRIVLYFYPMDDTPGCAKQACSLRDSYGLFEKNNIVVLGISYGSVESHKKFKEKYHLPFILLSDNKKQVAKAYAAKSKWIFVPQRKTYLVDEQGMVKDILEDVDPATHTRLVLEKFGVH